MIKDHYDIITYNEVVFKYITNKYWLQNEIMMISAPLGLTQPASSSYVPQAKGPETTARWFRIGRRLITPCGGLMLYIWSGIIREIWHVSMHAFVLYIYI